MVKIDETLTRQVADLARLELSPGELKTFTAQLGEVLKYMDLLTQADVKGVEPMTTPLELTTPLREDIVRPSPTDSEGKPKVLTYAPDVLNDGFKVPQIL
jgi:aspartyl-tRNA(Asn)/glutamyl-tRNA(Gln) amidotransferase subunit C